MNTLPERLLWKLAMDDDGHWIWTGGTARGYGQISYEGRPQLVHRLVARLLGFDIEGKVYRHAKDCPKLCVNPYHARHPGAVGDNNSDRSVDGVHYNQLKTHCPQGHPYSEENTYVIPTTGGRQCRSCVRDHGAAYRTKKSLKNLDVR